MRPFFRTALVTCCVCLALLGISGAAESKGFDPFATGQPDPRKSAKNAITNLEFVDTPITTVFKMISDLTGSSIIMSPAVSKQPPRINIWIKNLTPQQVLDQDWMDL